MKKILDAIFSDNGEFVVRFLFAVVFMLFFIGNLMAQSINDTDEARQEYMESVKEQQQMADEERYKQKYRKHMIEKQMMYNKVQGQKQIKKIIIEKERKRKFMKRKIRRERIKTFIIGIGIGYAIGGK